MLRQEFQRDGLGATRAALDEAYASACAEGYLPACDPGRWRLEDQPSLAALTSVFSSPCGKGDPAACTVLGWIADHDAEQASAPNAKVSLYRQAARYWKGACDGQKFQPACFDYADQLFEARGVDAEPAAGVARWERSCTAGYAPSCSRLAALHTTGVPGAKADEKKALTYAEEGCAGGDPAGCAARDALVTPADPAAAAGALCDRGLLAACWQAVGSDMALLTPTDPGFRWLGMACGLGASDACGEAGRILNTGGDADAALHSWSLGCRQGDPDSCASLVTGTAAAPTAVLRQPAAFRIACFLADSEQACTTWGTALLDGVLPRDEDSARRALERACQETSGGRACTALGNGFEGGLVGERDRTLAARYYGWACAQGEFEACERRGDLLVSAVGVRRDDAVALATFSRACTGGRASGCYKAGRVLDLGTELPRDAKQAKELYNQACSGGVPEACYGLGQILEEDTPEAPADYAGARDAYEKAVAGGSVEAHVGLARLLWNGLGGALRRTRARELAEQACQMGERRACQGPSFL